MNPAAGIGLVDECAEPLCGHVGPQAAAGGEPAANRSARLPQDQVPGPQGMGRVGGRAGRAA